MKENRQVILDNERLGLLYSFYDENKNGLFYLVVRNEGEWKFSEDPFVGILVKSPFDMKLVNEIGGNRKEFSGNSFGIEIIGGQASQMNSVDLFGFTIQWNLETKEEVMVLLEELKKLEGKNIEVEVFLNYKKKISLKEVRMKSVLINSLLDLGNFWKVERLSKWKEKIELICYYDKNNNLGYDYRKVKWLLEKLDGIADYFYFGTGIIIENDEKKESLNVSRKVFNSIPDEVFNRINSWEDFKVLIKLFE